VQPGYSLELALPTQAAQGWMSTLPCSKLTDAIDRILASNQIQTDSRKIGPRVLKIVLFLFFPEATPQRSFD
jgi:hypothetical protein